MADRRSHDRSLSQRLERVRALAVELVSDPDLAEELGQEVALRSWRRETEGRPVGVGWARRVIANLAGRLRRRDRSRRVRELRSVTVTAKSSDPADAVAMAESLERVVHAARTLPEPYRTAILEHYLEERPATQIAERTGVPVETVRTRLRRGLAHMRQSLSEDDRRLLSVLVLTKGSLVPATTGGLVMLGKGKLLALAVLLVAAAWVVEQWREGEAPSLPSAVSDASVHLETASASSGLLAPSPVREPVEATKPGLDEGPVPGPGPADGWPFVVVDDRTGQPLADVEVVHTSEARGWRGCLTLLEDEPLLHRNSSAVLTTDEHGTGTVRWNSEFGPAAEGSNLEVLYAVHGGLRGFSVYGSAATSPLELRLREAWDVRVLVRDAQGSPVADAPVCFGEWEGEGPVRFLEHEGAESQTRTNSEGLATLRGVDLLTSGRTGTVTGLGIPLVAHEPPFLGIDPRDPPRALLELTLPEVGAVEFRVVDAEGVTIPASGTATLLPVLENEEEDPDQHRFVEVRDGLARFDLVPVGSALFATVKTTGLPREWRRIDPPTRPGEVVEVEFVQRGPTWNRIVGRARSPSGAALVEAELQYQLLLETGCEGTLVTDREGRFRIDLFPESVIGSGEEGVLSLVSAEHPLWRATMSFPLGGAGPERDVGELQFVECPVLVQGLVRDDLGRPLAGAEVRVVVEGDLDPEERRELPRIGSSVHSDDAGCFVVPGDFAGRHGKIRARFRSSDVVSVPFLAGDTEIAIEIPRPAVLAVEVLLPPEVEPRDLSLVLWPSDRPNEVSFAGSVPSPPRFTRFVSPREPWSLGIALPSDRQVATVAVVERIEVEAGTLVRDPRLNPLDLRGKVFGFEVQVMDREGQLLDGAEVAILELESEEVQVTRRTEGGSVRLLSGAPRARIRVRAPAMREQTLWVQESPTRVTMERAQSVEVDGR